LEGLFEALSRFLPDRPRPGHRQDGATFIPADQLDTRYLDTPYYVVPRDQIGEEAFAVIRDAMRRQDAVGMARVVLARREHPIILEPVAEPAFWNRWNVRWLNQSASRSERWMARKPTSSHKAGGLHNKENSRQQGDLREGKFSAAG